MLENPISAEMSHMRPALLPGLLQAAARNQARGFMPIWPCSRSAPPFTAANRVNSICWSSGLLVGRTGPKDVHGTSRAVDVFDVKADAEAVLAAMGAPAKVQILRGASEWWHPGRHGMICLGPKKVLGVFGELHPKVVCGDGYQGRRDGLYPVAARGAAAQEDQGHAPRTGDARSASG